MPKLTRCPNRQRPAARCVERPTGRVPDVMQCVCLLLCAEAVHGVRRGHAHHHVEEHHLQPGIAQRPAAAPALLHQTRQGRCPRREEGPSHAVIRQLLGGERDLFT